MEGTIDSLQIEIGASAGTAEQKIKHFTDMLKNMKQVTTTSGFSAIANSIRGIGSAADNAESKVSRLIERLSKLKSEAASIKGFSSKMILGDSGGSFKGWNAEKMMDMGQYEQLDRRLGLLMDKMEVAAAKGNDLQAMQLAAQANKIKAQLDSLENTANETASRFTALRESIRSTADSSIVKGFKHIESAVKRIILYRAIRAGLSYISNGFKEGLQNAYAFSQVMGGELAASMDRLTGAGSMLKNQLGAAFGGLIQAAEPVLARLIDLATRAADALSQLMAAIGGRAIYKKATAQAKQWASAAGSAAKATEEWKNQLMGFDEINRLDDMASNTGGGGAGGLGNFADDFDYAEISDFWKRVSDLFSSLKLSISDVLFDWKNLNKEQIAQKLVAGLCGILGGITGFMIGGVPGAIVGTLTGVGIGLLIDSVIFNHDGILSRGEIAEMLSGALYGLAGGVVGFMAGGPAGALIGASVGIGLFATLKTIDFLADGKYSRIVSQLATALTALTGGIIGFMVGGPVGAALGAMIGIGITATIESLKLENKNDELRSQYKSGMSWFICGVLGLPTDEEWKQYGSDAIKWLGEGFSDLLTELHNIIGGPLETLVEEDIPHTFSALKDLGSKAIDWIRGGVENAEPSLEESLHTNVDEPVTNTFLTCRAAYEEYQSGYDQFASSVDMDNSTIGVSTDVMSSTVMADLQNVQTETMNTDNAFSTMSANGAGAMSAMESNVTSSGSRIQQALSSIKEAARSAWDAIQGASARAEANIEANGGLWTSNFASGGFPETGEVFLARENGPEMVGTIGGRTAVANNHDIVAAIEGGVYNAMAAVMTATGGRSSGVSININGREFYRATWEDRNAVIAEHGVSLITNG